MYFPKNKIKTNLLTKETNEFLLKKNNTPYSGYYWKTSDGKYYTGKSPENLPTEELILNPKYIEGFLEEQTKHPLLVSPLDESPRELYTEDPFNSTLISNYINQTTTTPTPIKNLPDFKLNPPTSLNYTDGHFNRYFVIKNNESIYIEVNEFIYKNLLEQNPEWEFNLYTPFICKWVLVGIEKDVIFLNTLNVNLTEQKLKRKGLHKYLKFDYLKYYK